VFSKTRPHAAHPCAAEATRAGHSENSARIRARDKPAATGGIPAGARHAARRSPAHRIAGPNHPDCASSKATRGIRAADRAGAAQAASHRIAPYNHPDCDL